MTDKLTALMYEPIQAHKALNLTIWPMLKAHLTAGRRMVVELRHDTRSSAQNRRLWSQLSDIAEQVVWHGQKLSAEDWKHILSSSLKKQRVAPGIDGGFVVLGLSTSKMSRPEMSELQELISAFGAQHAVKFKVEQE